MPNNIGAYEIEGIIVERKNNRVRMVLAITILGQGAMVEIDTDTLELVS
jgi:hypothetical protein